MKKKSIDIFQDIIKSVIKYFKWFVVAAVALFLLTGVYKVDENEVALVLRFGKLVGSVSAEQIKQPGLHFTLPNIIDEVVKVPVKAVQQLNVVTHYSSGDTSKTTIRETGYAITGNSNIVLIKTAVKYTVNDPIQYALYVSDIPGEISGVVSGETTAIVSSMNVDDVLTSKKTGIASNLLNRSQEILNELNAGVTITNIEITSVTPPTEAKEAFESVVTASVKKQTMIQEANDYTESTIPQAQAESDALVSSAKSTQSSSIAKANEEVAEFNGLLSQYNANPNVIINGVFRTRVSEILAQTGATIIIPDGEDSAKIILP